MAHQLPELSELSQQEVFTIQNGHPVVESWGNMGVEAEIPSSPLDLPPIYSMRKGASRVAHVS